MKDNNFSYSAENFRAISIIFVVLSHLSNLPRINNSLIFFLIDATTWFLFISGYLFCLIESRDKFSYVNYLKKKIKFVIFPYVCISFFCIAVGVYYGQHKYFDISLVNYILWSLVVGGNVNFPMWFIPMIIIFFIFSPVFYSISKMSAFPLLIISILTLMFSIFSSRPAANSNPFYSFLHFLGFYIFGVFIFRSNHIIVHASDKKSLAIIILGIVGFLVTMLINNVNYVVGDDYINFFSEVGNLNLQVLGKFFLLVSIFIFFEKFYNSHNRIMKYISGISFGLFFFHGIFIVACGKFLKFDVRNEILALLIELFLVSLLSILTIESIKKILKNRSKYVVGC